MHASEHGRSVADNAIGTDEEAVVEETTRGPALRYAGTRPAVQAALGGRAHQQTASEQAYGGAPDDRALAAIQGHAMFALLPELEKLPPQLLDEHRARAIGGPRLAIAVRAVRAKRGGLDIHQLAAATPEIGDLPGDQIAELKAYYLQRTPHAVEPKSSTTAETSTEKMPEPGTLDAEVAGNPIDAPLVAASFLGEAIQAHPMLAARLRLAEERLTADLGLAGAELAKALGVRHGYNVQRKPRTDGYHFYGLAIDINYSTNPWVGGQYSGGTNHSGGDEEAMAAIWRACWLTGHGQAVSSADSESRFRNKKGSTGELWDHLHDADQALREYLGAANNLPQVESWLAAKNLDRVVAPPNGKGVSASILDQSRLSTADAATWVDQIRADLATSHGAKASGSNWWQTGAGQRSDLGFLDLDRRLVIALREVGGLSWGAADFGGEASGDMMHFDCRSDYPKPVLDAANKDGKSNQP